MKPLRAALFVLVGGATSALLTGCSSGMSPADAAGTDDTRVGPADARGDAPSDHAADAPVDAALDAPDAGADSGPVDDLADAAGDVGADAPLDAPIDAPLDAPIDARADGADDARADVVPDAPMDARADASADASADVVDVVDVSTDVGGDASMNHSPVALLLAWSSTYRFLGSYYRAGGSWDAFTLLASSTFFGNGGGVTVLPDGRGVAHMGGGAGGALYAAMWNGTWSAAAGVHPFTSLISPPVATPTGAVSFDEAGTSTIAASFNTFDDYSSSWTTTAAFTPTGRDSANPALALTAAGDPVVVTGDYMTNDSYAWSRRSGGVWSAPHAIAGITPTERSYVAAVRRVGADQIVAAFIGQGATLDANLLQVATFTGGAWSAPTTVASTDLGSPTNYQRFGITALPDGRVALVYAAGDATIKLGFFNGTTWGTFTAVPMAVGYTAAVAPGLAGAELELVYLDEGQHPAHTRLTSTVAWSWTHPTVLDTSVPYISVWLATGP